MKPSLPFRVGERPMLDFSKLEIKNRIILISCLTKLKRAAKYYSSMKVRVDPGAGLLLRPLTSQHHHGMA